MIHFITKEPKQFYPSNITVHNNIEDSGLLEYCFNKMSTNKLIGLDTETEGFDPHSNKLLLLQLGDNEVQYVIDTVTIGKNEYEDVFELDLIFLIHNATFDLKFLFKQGIYNIKTIDTYIAEAVQLIGKKMPRGYKGLDQVVNRYLKVTLSKEARGLIHRLGRNHADIVEYAAKDVIYLELVWERQKEKLIKNNLLNFFHLENEYTHSVAYMMYNGIKLDKDRWKAIYEPEKDSLAKVEKELNDYILNNPGFEKWIDPQLDLFNQDSLSTTVNWNSDKQVLEIMKYIGLNCKYIEKGVEKEGVGVKVITPQKDKHPLVPIFMKYQKLAKAVSTFGETYFRFINKNTQRIHTTYNQLMNTTRMSCGDSSEKDAKYPNLQQVPSGARRDAFVAEEGNVITAIDYDGQEDIIFANKCLDPELLAFYDNKMGDGHSYVAKLCFPEELKDIPLDQVKKQRPDLRQKAKSANFAIKFGGVGFTISNNLSISEDEGEAIYKAYMKAFPGIAKYFKKVADEAEKNGYVLISKVSGAKSYFDFYDTYLELKEFVSEKGFWDIYRKEKADKSLDFIHVLKPKVKEYFKYKGIMQRRSYNFPIQGEAANITKFASILFYRWIIKQNLWGKVLIIHAVHDEVLVEYPEDLQPIVEPKLKECLETSGAKFCKRIPLTATPATGKHWIH